MEGLGLRILYILSSVRKSDRSRRTAACSAGEPDTNKNPPVLHPTPTHASKRQSFPTGTRDAIRRGPIGQRPYSRGLIGACGDFSWLRKLRQGQEFPVPSSNVVAPDYSAPPTLAGFVARAAGSKG